MQRIENLRLLSLRARLAGTFLLIIVLLVGMAGWYLLHWTETHYTAVLTDELLREGRTIGSIIDHATPRELPALIDQAGRDLGRRITIISLDGRVIADSAGDYRQMPGHADRPEVRQALVSGYGSSVRTSSTLKTRMLYVATRYGSENQPQGVARIAEPLSTLRLATTAIQRTFLLAGLAALVLAALLAVWLASSVTAPLKSVVSAAQRIASGDLGARAAAIGNPAPEVSALAESFNDMAGQLQATIEEITGQKTRMQTLFERVADGLMLVGSDARIQMINPAACRMLSIDGGQTTGKTVIEGTLSHDLSGLVERVLRLREPGALDVTLPASDGTETALQAYVDPVPRADGGADALVLLRDVTSWRRLEAVRRDFVANVSHELRTPLASMRAMAETIQLHPDAGPDVAAGLAQSIVQETDRLNLLASDLLELAETESGQREAAPEETDLSELVSEMLDTVRPTAERKGIEMVSVVRTGERLVVDRGCLSRILVNLVSNAVSYTPQGGRVAVSATRQGDEMALSVEDNGIGIPPECLPRVFERFYRVDRARSRESGGTGLGLSIVKHLTEALGGSVSVASEPGKGTVFTLLLPSRQATPQAREP